MNKIFSTLFSAARAKIKGIWNKLKLLSSSTFWKTKAVTTLRQFFSKVLDVKPKNKSDYYTVLRWLISKRLAYALIIALGVGSVCLIFTMSPSIFSDSGSDVSIRTYKYNSLPLKYYKGTVRILAADRHVAYVGAVDSGAAKGSGSLYSKDGSLVYEGAFADNMFNGKGKIYYSDGTLKYSGDFVNNQFNGSGNFYRKDGGLEYSGAFENGLRSGTGSLYNSGGNLIFTGAYSMDNLIYSQFVGKTVDKAAAIYKGTTAIYSSDSEYCVAMSEIGAVYTVESGENTLDNKWTINGIHVLKNTLTVSGKNLKTINELTEYFGKPTYFGSTWVKLPEAVSINLMQDNKTFKKVDMTMTSAFDKDYTVTKYDTNYEVYVYSYEMDGLIYSFYSGSSSASGFLMYAVTFV